jgi:hypothetical protein
MKKTSTYITIALIMLACIGIAVKKYSYIFKPKAHYPASRNIQYSFSLQNKTNRLVNGIEFWAYAPLEKTSTQRCINLETSPSFQLILDSMGNRILHFTFSGIPPFGTKIITVKADLQLSNEPNRLCEKEFDKYLSAEKYCESENTNIVALAKKLKGSKPEKTAENIFRWVSGNVKYAGYLKNARGAIYAMKNKKGDCTEFMYLFSALCRASHIPARNIGGYVCSQNSILKPSEYHNWAEFYDNGAWKIADPQRKVFMQNPSHYIAMHIINESPDNPMGNYNRFLSSGKGIKAKMNG